YIASFTADEKEMTRYIIGTMSVIDSPLTPSLFGAISMRSYMNGLSDEAAQKARNQILDATDETIRSLADSVREVVESGYICVVGSETAVEKEKALFNHIEPLV
ncbi:MAG: insulinase family protein, partial [Lachnospiraceae bacterium]|nr:insulinase family protein [Lachnospiraceae bacterium]